MGWNQKPGHALAGHMADRHGRVDKIASIPMPVHGVVNRVPLSFRDGRHPMSHFEKVRTSP